MKKASIIIIMVLAFFRGKAMFMWLFTSSLKGTVIFCEAFYIERECYQIALGTFGGIPYSW